MSIRLKTGIPQRERQDISLVMPQADAGPSPCGSTFYKTLLACPREWALYYLVGLRPDKTSEALTYGLLWHYCLEAYYNGLLGGDSFQVAAAKAYDLVNMLVAEDGYQEIVATLTRMLDSYFDQFSDDSKNWSTLAVEETLIYEGAFMYSARLDLVVEDKTDSGLWIVEHKSSRLINSHLLDSYQLDMQILGQVWLLNHCVDLNKYPTFKGVKVNIATKQATPQCVRLEVYPSRYHLEAFERSIAAWDRVKDYCAECGYPQALGHCSGYARGYGRCAYYDLCHGHPLTTVEQWQDSTDEQLPFGYRRAIV